MLDLEGYEGPIDVLLALARQQKVDLARISILDLAEQYLAFIAEARRLDLEIAADYLVMAAWLVYLKSRLLLPDEDDDEEPSGPELAAALALKLRRLRAMQEKGQQLMARPLLGREVFARGEPQEIEVVRHSVYEYPFSISCPPMARAAGGRTIRCWRSSPARSTRSPRRSSG